MDDLRTHVKKPSNGKNLDKILHTDPHWFGCCKVTEISAI
jgi:hypothetical protein